MRDCPSCGHMFRSVIVPVYNHTSLVNAGLTAPKLSLCACEVCKMMYVDGGQVDQAWFDWYYLNHYKTDDKPYSDERLESLAACVLENIPDAGDFVLDIGGMDLELANRLDDRGFHAIASGVGQFDGHNFCAVILSHTLEHIYDVPAMFQRIRSALVPGGLLFIEVPVWLTDENSKYLDDPNIFDNHWQHINKFRSIDLEKIFIDNDFEIIFSQQIEDYREYHVWRIIGKLK